MKRLTLITLTLIILVFTTTCWAGPFVNHPAVSGATIYEIELTGTAGPGQAAAMFDIVIAELDGSLRYEWQGPVSDTTTYEIRVRYGNWWGWVGWSLPLVFTIDVLTGQAQTPSLSAE